VSAKNWVFPAFRGRSIFSKNRPFSGRSSARGRSEKVAALDRGKGCGLCYDGAMDAFIVRLILGMVAVMLTASLRHPPRWARPGTDHRVRPAPSTRCLQRTCPAYSRPAASPIHLHKQTCGRPFPWQCNPAFPPATGKS